MRIIATINEVSTRNWKVNAGEYKVKKCTVETPQEFAECDAIMVSFSSKENGKFVSWVKNGKCDIPCFANPGNVTVGVFAYTETDGKLELRYSPTPVVMPINMGSYIEGEKPPTPTPGTYAELLEQIATLEKGTIKELDEVNLISCESGVYLTSKIRYRKAIISQPFEEMIPVKALLIVVKNETGIIGTQFQWIGASYILAGLSNAEGEFENEFTKYTFEDYATKEYVNKLIENIESGGSDYTLPIGGDELGGVKNGGNVVINEDGTMTAPESEVTDEQVSSAVSDWIDANPDKVTTVQDGAITRVKVADELLTELGLDANHHLTEVKLETFRCNWDGTPNANGNFTMTKPFKTPTYIKINQTIKPHADVATVFSSVEDFSTDVKGAPDTLFWRYYKADELEPMYMEKVPGYEYCRMEFKTKAIEITAYYDSYERPISTEKTKAELGLWKDGNRVYVAAVVPYKNCKFYLDNSSQINSGQSLTDVYGTSNENIFADTVRERYVINSGTVDTDFSTYVHLFKVGEYSEVAEGETWKTFDASAIVDYHPKYLVFPLVRNNCSETTRDAIITAFRNDYTYTIRGGLSDKLPIRIDKFQNAEVKNPLIGKHWLLLGDSITDWFAGDDYSGKGFASKIALEFDMTFSNIAYEGENLDGGISRLNSYIEGIASGENITPDYITIAYGTNGMNGHIGTVEDSEDTATYPGWVKKTISIIRENFPNAVFGFVLPPQGDWTGVNNSKDIKGNHDAIKAVLETDAYAVPYIDMYTQSGITPDLLPSDNYPNDRIHLRSARSQNLYYHAMRRFMMGL